MAPAARQPSVAGESGLHAEDVTVSFSGLVALSEVTFGVRPGEIVGLIGPNGAGKTTLLNVLTGFQIPDEGRVLLDGRVVSRWAPDRRARHGIGRTFQGVRPFGRLTVRENIEIGALGVGTSSANARRTADELLESYELSAAAELPASALPAGMQRRLGIARALASSPSVLLLDEPAAGLNEAEDDELVELIKGVRDSRGCATIVVEHAMRVIMNLCDRLHVLDGGRTLAAGSPEEIRADPAVRAAYLGAETGAGA